MIALISPAKTMRQSTAATDSSDRPTIDSTEPRFAEHSNNIASAMLIYTATELSQIFKVSDSIARGVKSCFQEFFDLTIARNHAIESYDGVVYKHLTRADEELSLSQQRYLQKRLRISSLLYGLLRPLDLIKPYRMEGFIYLATTNERVDHFWRAIQTQQLIDDVKEEGGVLIYLAAKEEKKAFNWREVTRQVRVIEILFLQPKGDKLRQVVIYTKMARGEMVRYMMMNNISDPEALKSFEWSGYSYNESLSKSDVWVWVLDC